MIVAISLADGIARLQQPEDFGGLMVSVTGTDRARLGEVLADRGRVVGDHVWLHAGWLESMGENSDEWRASFQAMLAKVERLGWYAREMREVRAHLECRAG